MFESIFQVQRVIEKHRHAPLIAEREQFLGHLRRQGYCELSVRATANYLLHIIRILKLEQLRIVHQVEIEKGGAFWASYRGPFREKKQLPGSPTTFVLVARAWFQFHGKLALPPDPPFSDQIREFIIVLQSSRGLSQATVLGYSRRAHGFLKWFAQRSDTLSTISVSDIDDFLAEKRALGWKPRGLATQCQAMRTFFWFAESQGWCAPGIPLGIRSPRIPKYEERLKGPTWSQVQRLLRSANGTEPNDLRAKAILLLLAIYGLRSSEITGLRLDDFDWRSETFAVRRAKRGGIQHYPIQYEVGEAILAYLRSGRPSGPSRYLFVSVRRPWGRIAGSVMWQIVGSRMRSLGFGLDTVGPHALRHACATRLLQKGASLKEIAEFLGHRNTKSIGIYAKYDIQALRKVAAFRLTGL